MARCSQPDWHVKGNHPLTEHYSIVGAEVATSPNGDQLTEKSDKLMSIITSYDAIIIAGQAKSHCVAWTIADLLEQIQAVDDKLASKIYLLEDCTSPVVVPGLIDYTQDADAAFRRFAQAGMHVVRSTDPMTAWPEIREA
jgi:nicotinamidase-related amidase